jgi:hypothetical protein
MTMMMEREKELACFLRPFHHRQANGQGLQAWCHAGVVVRLVPRPLCVSVKGRLLWCGGRETKWKQGPDYHDQKVKLSTQHSLI